MKFNDKEIAQLSEKKCDLEGRLNYSRAMFNQSGIINCLLVNISLEVLVMCL